jgi:hypothetical protein
MPQTAHLPRGRRAAAPVAWTGRGRIRLAEISIRPGRRRARKRPQRRALRPEVLIRGKVSCAAIYRGRRWRATDSTNYGGPNAPMTVPDLMGPEPHDLLQRDLLPRDLETPNSGPPERGLEPASAREPQAWVPPASIRQASIRQAWEQEPPSFWQRSSLRPSWPIFSAQRPSIFWRISSPISWPFSPISSWRPSLKISSPISSSPLQAFSCPFYSSFSLL